jgi:hypothetical protein
MPQVEIVIRNQQPARAQPRNRIPCSYSGVEYGPSAAVAQRQRFMDALRRGGEQIESRMDSLDLVGVERQVFAGSVNKVMTEIVTMAGTMAATGTEDIRAKFLARQVLDTVRLSIDQAEMVLAEAA